MWGRFGQGTRRLSRGSVPEPAVYAVHGSSPGTARTLRGSGAAARGQLLTGFDPKRKRSPAPSTTQYLHGDSMKRYRPIRSGPPENSPRHRAGATMRCGLGHARRDTGVLPRHHRPTRDTICPGSGGVATTGTIGPTSIVSLHADARIAR